jgi:transposase
MYKGSFGQNGKKPKEYPREIRTQAVDLYNKCRDEYSSNMKAARHIADLLGIGSPDSIISWVKQNQADKGLRDGLNTEEKEEICRLRRENAELRRTNGILRAASAFFAAKLDRPQSRQ